MEQNHRAFGRKAGSKTEMPGSWFLQQLCGIKSCGGKSGTNIWSLSFTGYYIESYFHFADNSRAICCSSYVGDLQEFLIYSGMFYLKKKTMEIATSFKNTRTK